MLEINENIQHILLNQFQDKVFSFEETYNTLSFESDPSINIKLLQFLKEDERLQFTLLNDLCGAHFPDIKGNELAVFYHLKNIYNQILIRFVIRIDILHPSVFTATKVFESANWMERETFDFFGIEFVGHPNLKRILNVDEMDYFPLRKEYPLEDQTRLDKDDQMFGRGSTF